MLRLPASLQAWGSPDFKDVLKREIEQLDAGELPLQQALSFSSHALGEGFSVMILGVGDTPTHIHATAGVFFSGVIAGCNCADDPTPVEPQHEYCELRLTIDRGTADTTVTP